MRLIIVALSVSHLSMATVAAQTPPPRLTAEQQAALRAACRADGQALCSGVTPGGGRILECMRSNQAKLSGACSSALQRAGLIAR